MTKQQMVDLVERQLRAYNSKTLHAFLDCYHHEVRVMDLISGNLRSEGMTKLPCKSLRARDVPIHSRRGRVLETRFFLPTVYWRMMPVLSTLIF